MEISARERSLKSVDYSFLKIKQFWLGAAMSGSW